MRPAMRAAAKRVESKRQLKDVVKVVKKIFGSECKVIAVPSKGWVGVRTSCKSCGAEYPVWIDYCSLCGR